MKKITPRSTKSEILSAYNALNKELRALRAKKAAAPAPQKALPPSPEEILANKELSMADIIGRLRGLTTHIGDSASSLQAELTTEATTLEQLRAQAETVTTELATLHGIEVTEQSLTELIARYADNREAADTELTARTDAFEVELAAQRDAWTKDQHQHATTVREAQEEQAKADERDAQEYAYDRELRLAQQADARAQAEQQFGREQAALREQAAQAWAEREKLLHAREQEAIELTAKAEAFEGERTAAVKKAEGEGTGIAKRQAKTRGDLTRKDNEAVRRVSELKVESLQQTIGKQEGQIEELSRQLEGARKQTTELAVKAIDGASNASSFAAIKEIALEQAKNTQKGK